LHKFSYKSSPLLDKILFGSEVFTTKILFGQIALIDLPAHRAAKDKVCPMYRENNVLEEGYSVCFEWVDDYPRLLSDAEAHVENYGNFQAVPEDHPFLRAAAQGNSNIVDFFLVPGFQIEMENAFGGKMSNFSYF
jgi:hypothetical protein